MMNPSFFMLLFCFRKVVEKSAQVPVLLTSTFFAAREDFFTTEATENAEEDTEKNRLVFLQEFPLCPLRPLW